MNAHPNSISDVFSSQKQYVIPVFQRTYEYLMCNTFELCGNQAI
jgi:hypothetical protein